MILVVINNRNMFDITDIISVKICEEFYKEFKRLPNRYEIFKGFHIGDFVFNVRCGKYNNLKDKLENIFNVSLKYSTRMHMTDEELIQRCKIFYKKYGRLPKSGEKLDGWNISAFMDGLKRGRHSNIKQIIENIFKQPIEVKCTLTRYSTKILIKKCQEFYDEFHRLPKQKEEYKGWKIGIFVHGLKYRKNQNYKKIFEDIFKQKIFVKNKISDEDIIKYSKEFYEKYNRLPVRSDVYKGWNIGTYVHGLKNGSNKHMKKTIEEIFGQEIDFNYKIFKMNDDEIIDLCKEFYEEFHRLPEVKESYKGWKIGNFIQEIKDGKHKIIKPVIAEIFNESI